MNGMPAVFGVSAGTVRISGASATTACPVASDVLPPPSVMVTAVA